MKFTPTQRCGNPFTDARRGSQVSPFQGSTYHVTFPRALHWAITWRPFGAFRGWFIVPTKRTAIVPTKHTAIVPTKHTAIVPTKHTAIVPTEHTASSQRNAQRSSQRNTQRSSQRNAQRSSQRNTRHRPNGTHGIVPTEHTGHRRNETHGIAPTTRTVIAPTVRQAIHQPDRARPQRGQM